MNFKMVGFVLLVAFIGIRPAFGAEVQCTDRPECWPDGSAMRTAMLAADARQKVEARLAQAHKALIDLLWTTTMDGKPWMESRLPRTLESQQAAWLKYRTEECELVGTLTQAGGTWPTTHAIRCELNHTERRLRRVQAAIRCIQRIAPDERWLRQNACLQQLAPLTNHAQT
jgi:uncharacterized protein YecT (DUF1311 family)